MTRATYVSAVLFSAAVAAAGLADDLARYLAGFPVQAGRPAVYRSLALWAVRHRRNLTAATVGFLAAAGVGTGLLLRAYTAERAARVAADEARGTAEAARKAVASYTLAIDDILYASPGQLDTERALLEQAVQVQERQLQIDPGDLRAVRHLAHASWRLGRVYCRSGRAAEAAAHTRRAIESYGTVAAADPGNPLHRLDVARSYSILAWAYRLITPRDDAAALEADAAAMLTTRSLMLEFPDDLRVRDAAATYLAVYGQALAEVGRHADAEACFRDAAAEADRCRAERPDLWKLASPAMHARTRLSQALAFRGRLADALTENAAALALCDGLVARAGLQNGDADRLELLSFRLSRRELLRNRGDWLVAAGGDATAVARDLGEMAKLIAAEHPDRRGDETTAALHLSAWAAQRAGRPETAAAARAYEAALLALPPSVNRAVFLSRMYADGPGPRDTTKALAAAQEAVRLAPDDPLSRQALGAALYRLGRLAEADAELARVTERPPSRTVGFLRASIAARTGRVEAGRRLFAEMASAPVPCEPCTPELEQEVRAVLAAAG